MSIEALLGLLGGVVVIFGGFFAYLMSTVAAIYAKMEHNRRGHDQQNIILDDKLDAQERRISKLEYRAGNGK